MMTVNKILKSFNKTLAQLEALSGQLSDRIKQNDARVEALNADSENALAERQRAIRAAENIRGILG